MTKRSATDVLRRHARERWLRRAVRSVTLDGDRDTSERMGEGEWVDTCQLATGVPAELLDVLGLQECEGGDEAPVAQADREAAEHMGIPYERVIGKWAARLTMVEAARRLGLAHLDHARLKAMRLAAIATVGDNILARLGRERGRAA